MIRWESVGSLFPKLLGLSPFKRRLLFIAVDALLLPIAVWLSFWLRLANPLHPHFIACAWWLLPAVCLLGLPLYTFSGQYKGLTRYVGSHALYQLALRNGLLVMSVVACGWLLQLPMPPRSSWLLLWVLLTGFTGVVRFGLRDVLLGLQSKPRQLIRVAIYGAGAAGVQLAAALRLANTHSVEFWMMNRRFGVDRSMVCQSSLQVLEESGLVSIRFCWRFHL